MKCELKYIAHSNIEMYKHVTLKELLITVPIAILIVLFLNWWIGVKLMWILLLIVFGVVLCISFKDAIKYCKNRKEQIKMSSMKPENQGKPKETDGSGELVQILLTKENAYIFYDLMRYLPLFDPTCEQEVVFNGVMDQLQFQIGE